MEEEEEEGGAGGYSQFQSDSSGPATITSAVIMNTLFFLFSLKQKSQKEEIKKITARGVGLAFKTSPPLLHHTSSSSILRRSLAWLVLVCCSISE